MSICYRYDFIVCEFFSFSVFWSSRFLEDRSFWNLGVYRVSIRWWFLLVFRRGSMTALEQLRKNVLVNHLTRNPGRRSIVDPPVLVIIEHV